MDSPQKGRDEGVYTCAANNSHGDIASRDVQITVSGAYLNADCLSRGQNAEGREFDPLRGRMLAVSAALIRPMQ